MTTPTLGPASLAGFSLGGGSTVWLFAVTRMGTGAVSPDELQTILWFAFLGAMLGFALVQTGASILWRRERNRVRAELLGVLKRHELRQASHRGPYR